MMKGRTLPAAWNEPYRDLYPQLLHIPDPAGRVVGERHRFALREVQAINPRPVEWKGQL